MLTDVGGGRRLKCDDETAESVSGGDGPVAEDVPSWFSGDFLFSFSSAFFLAKPFIFARLKGGLAS